MTTELSVELMCIVMRNGVQIWAEKERVQKLMLILSGQNAPQFIEYDGRFLNKSDLVGVYTAKDIEDSNKRRSGQKKCEWGFWHERNEKCTCGNNVFFLEPRDHSCEKCIGGYIKKDDLVKMCSCWFKSEVEKKVEQFVENNKEKYGI